MMSEEFAYPVMRERIREAAEIRRQREALAGERRGANPRSVLSGMVFGWLALRSHVARRFRTASA